MGNLYRLEDVRRPVKACKSRHPTYFSRTELNQLLSLYSRRVASGEWRDYAIDQRAGMAVFSIFRHTHDRPLFSIAKRSGGVGLGGDYLVYSGAKRLKQAGSITEALSIFEPKLRLVAPTGA